MENFKNEITLARKKKEEKLIELENKILASLEAFKGKPEY
jgi:hypothetical protein